MADRYPLIINPSANQIQEIPSGDNLNIGGAHIVDVAHINSTGVITATKFVGPMEGTVTGSISGTSGGLSGTPNINVGHINGVSADFTGNVSIAGTLTYEDVKNVDSVGLVTARNGFTVLNGTSTFNGPIDANVGIDVDGQTDLDNVNVSGVITATTYKGDADGLRTLGTGVTITAAGVVSATTYYGSGSNLTGIDATTIQTGNTSVQTVDTGSDGHVKITTEGTERLRIDSSGRLLLGTTTEGNASADDLTVATSGTTGITIRSGTSNTGNIYFSDATSGTGEFAGAIEYAHSGNSLRLHTNAAERLRITSAGKVGIGTNNPTNDLHYHKSSATGPHFHITNSSTGVGAGDGLVIGFDGGNNAEITNKENTSLTISTNAVERVRIDNAGRLGIGSHSQTVSRLYVDGGSFTLKGSDGNFNGGGNRIFIDHDNNDCRFGVTGGGGSAWTRGIRFYTSNNSTGTADRIRIQPDGSMVPLADNSYDLGSTSLRWRNVYTGDLHLSNDGSSNSVDGTSGSWTMQEGESDLFLINNKTGKKYKFNLTEVT